MIFNNWLPLLIFFAVVSNSFAGTPKAVLNLKLSKPATVNIKGKNFEFAGNYIDNSIAVGKAYGVNLPAQSLFGEKGTLAFDFKYKIVPGYNLKLRQFLTIRGKGRLYIGAYLRPNNDCYFAFRSTVDKNSLKSLKPLTPEKWYRILITWDKVKFKFYLNGKLQGEENQSIKAEFPSYSKLHFGPFKDRWTACKPWGGDDCFIKNLKIWDKDLNTKQILADSGVNIEDVNNKYPTFLRIPKVNITPVIDGEIADKEWEKASSFITLYDARKPFQSLSYENNRPLLCHDGKNLYISFQTLFPKGAKILSGSKRPDKKQDSEVWGSESFEIYFYIKNKLYRFGGNVAGGSCESLDSQKDFYAEWRYRSNLKFQIDNRWLWQAEIAIPLAEIGLENIDKEPQIKFNFCRTWQSQPNMGVTMLGISGNYNDTRNFATIKLGNSTIASQTREISNPDFGQFKDLQSFYSVSKSNLCYQVKLLDNTGAIPEYSLVDDKIVTEKKVITKTYQDKISISSFNRILFKLEDDKGNLILQQLVPFKLNKNYINITPVFSKSRIIVNISYSMLKENYPGDKFMVRLLSADNKVMEIQEINNDKDIRLKFDRSNPEGEYVLQIIDSKGEILDQKKVLYIGKAEWENYNETSEVIPPFTPLVVKKSPSRLEVASWNRHYILAKSLQPSQIISGDKKLLIAPINLEIDGEKIPLSRFEITEHNSARVAYEASGDNRTYGYKQTSFIEYDGVLFNKLSIRAKKDLSNIRFIIPINSKFSKFLHATRAGFGGGGEKNFAIDKDVNLGFYPSIWMGSEERGLVFFAESNHAWRGKENVAIQLKHYSGRNVLQVTFADKLPAGEKINLEFGLLATPVKPLPNRYPLNIFNWSYPIHLNQAPPKAPVTYINNTSSRGWGFFDLPLNDKDHKTSKWLEKHIKESKSRYSVFAPYFANMFLHEDYPAVISNISEWQRVPASHLLYERDGKMYRYFWLCPKSDGRKFFLYKFSELLKRHLFKAVYFDFGPAYYCNNRLHGCNGGYPLMAQRKFYQGIARAFVQAGIKDYAIVVHNSDSIQFPSFTHVTHFFNGERLRQLSSSTFHFGKDLQDSFVLSDFASEYSSLPFGITSNPYIPTDPLLKRFGGGKEDQELYRFRMTKAAMAGTLIHDTICSPARMHYGFYDKVVRFYDEFGVPEAQFLPYWRNHKFVKVLKGKNIYVSLYKSNKTKEVLAVISHVAKEHLSQNVELQLYPSAFGFKSFKNARELFTSPDPAYDRLYKEKNRKRNPVKLGDFGIKFEGLKDNKIKLFLDFHSVALVKLEGE